MATINKYLNNLTPMRGVAALLTVIFHVDLMIGGGGGMLIKHAQSMLLTPHVPDGRFLFYFKWLYYVLRVW